MNLQRLQSDPAAFRAHLLIDRDGAPARLGDVLDPWQKQDFDALDPAWRIVAGQQCEASYQRGWLERPRGHSKTSDIAAQVTWALFSSRRQITGVVAAGDKDQAALIRDAILRLTRLNPWLGSILKVSADKIENTHTGSTCKIISSDAMTSYGLLVDFIVCDELCHWSKRDLWDSLLSSAAKRVHCLLLVITNAGFSDSWQFDTRQAVRDHRAWYFSRLDGPQASWITQERLDEQRKLLPAIAFARLWLNEWSSGSGDALDPDSLERAITLAGPIQSAEPGWVYYAGLDLGLSRDGSALAVIAQHVGHCESVSKRKRKRRSSLHRAMVDCGLWDDIDDEETEYVDHPATNKLKLAALHVWQPRPGQKVQIEPIEETIADLYDTFGCHVGCDPWQAAYLIERLQKRGIPTEPVDFSGPNLKSMCSCTLEAFSESQLALFNHARLLSDLRSLRVVERSYGVRLDSPRGVNGHGDSATSLAIALHLARSRANLTKIHPTDKLLIS